MPWSSVKEPFPEALCSELLQRETPHSYTPLHPFLKVPGRRAPYRDPQRGPYRNRLASPESFLTILHGPQQGSSPFRFPSQSSHRERHSTSRVPRNHQSKSQVDEPTPVCPPEERCPSPEPSFHNPGSPVKEPSAVSLSETDAPLLKPLSYISLCTR